MTTKKTNHTSMVIHSDLSQLSTVRNFVRRFLSRLPRSPVSEDRIDLMELAANECVVNIIRHAYDEKPGQEIHIEADFQKDRIDLKFYDWGKAWDPKEAPPPDFDGSREGGFGLYIISQAVDQVSYTRDRNGKNCAHFMVTIKEEI